MADEARVIESVCVFCGSNPGIDPAYRQIAVAMGAGVATRKLRLVYGGGRTGLMGALADAALAHNGEVIGIIPQDLMRREVGHTGLTELRVVNTMHERKALMAQLSDAFVAMPGGLGTLEEIFEVWTWAQLGIHAKPVALLNAAGYYDPLIEFIEHAVAHEFVPASHREMMIVESDVATLIDRLNAHRAPPVGKWLEFGQT